jgi:hypothetical protein
MGRRREHLNCLEAVRGDFEQMLPLETMMLVKARRHPERSF